MEARLSMRVSIIVPMLNEAAQLPELLAHLLSYQLAGCEIIFADGGSTDGSARLAELSGFTVVKSGRGRAMQMNAAAAHARGEVLLFLHADTRLPESAMQQIAQALADSNHCWGRFNVYITGRAWMLRVIARMINWRSRLSGIATGDQAIFVRTAVFRQIRGYPLQPLMEDVELCKRLLVYSRPAYITLCASTSGRRWEAHGVWRTIFLMWRLRWLYWRGADATELAGLYK